MSINLLRLSPLLSYLFLSVKEPQIVWFLIKKVLCLYGLFSLGILQLFIGLQKLDIFLFFSILFFYFQFMLKIVNVELFSYCFSLISNFIIKTRIAYCLTQLLYFCSIKVSICLTKQQALFLRSLRILIKQGLFNLRIKVDIFCYSS